MVIQRVWRSSPSTSSAGAAASTSSTASASNTHAISATSSSDPVPNVTVTGSSDTEFSGSTINFQRPKLTGDAMLEVLKRRYSGRSYANQSSSDAALKSLELLRSNLQYLFDKEIDVVIKKFSSLFFIPAIKNIKENLGENAISEETLKTTYCSLLEGSKAQYVGQISSPAENSLSRANTPGMELSDSDSSTDNVVPSGTTSLLQQALKRKLPEPNQPDTFKRQYFLQGSLYPQTQYPILQSLGNVPASLTYQHINRPAISNSTVFTTTISPETLFILDFKAGRALGVADFRDRLVNKHPEILRYCPDNQDREWLLQQKQISPLNRNGRFYLLVLDEVKKLAERNTEYSNNPYLKLSDLQGFKLTEFIYAKVQKLIKESGEQCALKAPPVISTVATIPSASSGSSCSSQQKPRVSSLSSSHATLTALLASPQQQAQPPANAEAVPPSSATIAGSGAQSSATSGEMKT
ncbi:deoxynucleotidyltransferase terminal-interacting protein 1 [Sabethes cyaneus]|uniref:deoxynucleotidyltransferase terminal-interacting protein 1 n=1 Tax=Sabethes cyaneus TaxID=53552 RepID=UPI00237E4C25|nr:deoxynucleotidyltransferase terminal-interacting protein 1 [Sabethes cyaneus]